MNHEEESLIRSIPTATQCIVQEDSTSTSNSQSSRSQDSHSRSRVSVRIDGLPISNLPVNVCVNLVPSPTSSSRSSKRRRNQSSSNLSIKVGYGSGEEITYTPRIISHRQVKYALVVVLRDERRRVGVSNKCSSTKSTCLLQTCFCPKGQKQKFAFRFTLL